MPDFDWAVLGYAAPYMLQGAVVTLEISICALVLGTVVGLVCGLLSVSDLAVPKAFVRAYVYFVRGTPALVQIFFDASATGRPSRASLARRAKCPSMTASCPSSASVNARGSW